MFIINFCLNMFRASLCPSSGEQMPCYCIWCILVWFSWTGPHNRYQPHPTKPDQYTPNAVTGHLFSWRWAYWCPKHVETEVNIKHLIVTSCWFSLFRPRCWPEEITICYENSLVQWLITNLIVILYLSTCHTVYISVLILFMIKP
jgi:hypothetical protein